MAQNISKKLSFVGKNIQKIRQVKNISQADFAALFELARPSVGAYEEGRSEPKIETLIQIANYFRISIDVLLTRELTVSEIYSFGLLNKKLNKAHQLIDVRGKSIKSPSIPLIQIDNFLNYIVNQKNSDFAQSLPEISVPISRKGQQFRAFEMNGSEMEYNQQGIHHGDILVGEIINLEDLSEKAGKVVTLVHKANISTRRLKSVTSKNAVLNSDDPNYPELKIPLEECLEAWAILSVYSSYLNPPTLIEERVLKLEKELISLKKT
jgi:transcriptional regulator with XRE-family HTH domain